MYEGFPPSRLVLETEDFVLLADMSPLVVGHLLLLPKRHYLSFSEVVAAHRAAVEHLVSRVLGLYRATFGEPLILEHGSTEFEDGNGCITHAHWHLLPVDGAKVDEFMVAETAGHVSLSGIADLADERWSGAYYLRGYGDDYRLYFPGESNKRQYLRSVAGRVLSMEDPEWDYAVVVRKEALRETMGKTSRWTVAQRLLLNHLEKATMSVPNVFSDEPTRLDRVISTLFANQSSAVPSARHADGTTVAVVAGADSQDDCAVLAVRGDQDLVIGSDYVRGPKFRLYEYGLLTEFDLGYYLVAANVSDVAAMGATPIGVVSVVRYPAEMDDVKFEEVMTGIRQACADFGAPNIGGDIGGAERLILSATAFGTCMPGRALMRGGARPGDLVCLTAPTGTAGAATEYFRSGRTVEAIENDHRDELLRSWTRPQARVREGVFLGRSGFVTSCQDTSDGLKATLECIARSSGVGVVVDEAAIVVPEAVTAVCRALSKEPLAVIMGDSVDFELVFTIPPERAAELAADFETAGLSFGVIGRITEEPCAVMRLRSGERVDIPGAAWRHATTA
ncbi:thiamine-phosphate kinase [Actinokineospora terrae]|uniref:thiamine-phosphate kinase n=1 Tax=Actinokineospora terrae TaxID=155974 RepID=UPI001160DD64|nr:thiamine-phosphate kinase [Actinokineospora terrae]